MGADPTHTLLTASYLLPVLGERLTQCKATLSLCMSVHMQCLKESFIKAEGSGLSFGLQNLEFETDPAHPWPPPSLTV